MEVQQSKEWKFFTGRLKEIASSLVHNGAEGVTQAAFQIGCLYSVALENQNHYEKLEEEEKDVNAELGKNT